MTQTRRTWSTCLRRIALACSGRSFVWRGLVLALLIAVAAPAVVRAESSPALTARKLESGVFTNVWNDESPEAGACTPPALQLEKSTDAVEASLLTRFGFTYMLSGGQSREHRLDIVIQHPPMENPNTQETLTEQVMEVVACPGTKAFAGWSFTSSWELVPGSWQVTLRQAGRELLTHTFEVTLGSQEPQMQLDYSLLPESENALDAKMLPREAMLAYLDNAGLGVSETVGAFTDRAEAKVRADQCGAQGAAAYVAEANGVFGMAYVVECIDYTKLQQQSDAGKEANEAQSAETIGTEDSVNGTVDPAPVSGPADFLDTSLLEDESGDVPGSAMPQDSLAPGESPQTSALPDNATMELLGQPAGGYAIMFALTDSSQVASRYAGVLSEKVGVELQVHRLPGGKDWPWLFAVLGQPQTRNEARRSIADMADLEPSPVLIKLLPLQALARGEGRTRGPDAGEAGSYDPYLAAMSRKMDAQALEALQNAEASVEDVPSMEEVSRMPDDPYARPEQEEQDEQGWTVNGRAGSRPGMQGSPPVSMPEKTGVDVLVARVESSAKAEKLAQTLGEVDAVVHKVGHRAYEVRVEDLSDTRAARKLVQQIAEQTGMNATVVMASRAETMEFETAGDAQEEGGYALQVISTRVISEAERYMETLRGKGYAPEMVEVSGKLGSWYSIRIGAYSTLEQAEHASHEFSKKERFSSTVVEKAGQ